MVILINNYRKSQLDNKTDIYGVNMHSQDQPTNPMVSIAMCTYNGEKYLRAQLESILSQTYTKLELVIVDDASKDGTVDILKEIADRDPRVKYQVNAETLGYNSNFEKAIRLCSSELIAISDQDDIWLPHKIMSLYPYINGDTLLVHSYNADFKNDDPSKTFFNPSRLRFKGNKTRELLFYNTVSGHATMIHKKLLSVIFPFPPGVYYDWWMGLNASLQGSIQLHPEALVLHRQHSSNASHISKQMPSNEIKENFFTEKIAALQTFTRLQGLHQDDMGLLNRFVNLLLKERRKNFSFPVLFFFLKHARSAFYFRKKTPMFFYYLKYSLKRATMKVKHWT